MTGEETEKLGEGNETTGEGNEMTGEGNETMGEQERHDRGRRTTQPGMVTMTKGVSGTMTWQAGPAPALDDDAHRDGGVLMPRGEEMKGGEGVGWTPPCERGFTRGFSSFNYSYSLPPLSQRGEGGFVLCRVPHTTTPLVNMCS